MNDKNKGGRPKLTPDQRAERVHVSVPRQTLLNASAAGLDFSAVFTVALEKKIAERECIQGAKETIGRAVYALESRLDKCGVLGPEERADFYRIRKTIFAIEGDAWIRSSKLKEIERLNPGDNGSDKNTMPTQTAKTDGGGRLE